MASSFVSNGPAPTSSYFVWLNYTAQKRYLEKLKIEDINLQDPFAITEDQWTENLSAWPDLEFGDMYMYLIEIKGLYTKESLKAYKSLEVYNHYQNGHVCTVYHFSAGNFSIFKAKINPSQRSADNNHDAWAIVCKENGSVRTGHCTCMAGYVNYFVLFMCTKMQLCCSTTVQD